LNLGIIYLVTKEKPKFNEALFWDVDKSLLDYDEDYHYIIERVILRGGINDVKELSNFYGTEKIKNVALNLRYLDKFTESFLSAIFDIPRKEFRCFKHRQLNQQHWIY
jgi:intein/homing endonuclease